MTQNIRVLSEQMTEHLNTGGVVNPKLADHVKIRELLVNTRLHLDQDQLPVADQSLLFRLKKRAEIRRQIPGRTSVSEGKPDKIANLLDEAADEIERLQVQLAIMLHVP